MKNLISEIIKIVQKIFPNAKIRNIYASTEVGAILKSENNIFEINNFNNKYVKIINNELYISSKFVSTSINNLIDSDWYPTGDRVQILQNNPIKFKIYGRINDVVNIGGNKVDVNEVEDEIRANPYVRDVIVYAKSNSITGNILVANIIKNVKSNINEKGIIDYLSSRLPNYKIPRIINFVEKFQLNRVGKVQKV